MRARATATAKTVKSKKTSAKTRADRELSDAELARMRPVALSKTIRWKLGLSQNDFAQSFGFAPGTVRDWEQYRSEPDAAARSYLETIAADPAAVLAVRKKIRHQAAA